ncbi:Tkl protein kinase [Globisporangium polare]
MKLCRVTTLVAAVAALLNAAAHARTDIPAQLQDLSRALTSPPPVPSRLNTALTTTLASQNLSSFTPALQRALLWNAGYVRVSSAGANATSYLDVYVPCGHTMNDVFLGVDAVSGVADCPLKVCKQYSLNFAQSTCDVDALAEITQCAVVKDDVDALSTAVANASRRPAWSQDGDLDSSFDPQMTLQKGTTETLYLISEQGAANFGGSDTTCLVTARFIVPCRQVAKADVTQASEEKKWCHPTSQLGVKLWLQSEVKAAGSTSNSGGSTGTSGGTGTSGTTISSDTKSSSSTVSVVLGVLLGLALLLCIVLLVLYCRKSKSSKSLENPETAGYTAMAVNGGGGAQHNNMNGSTDTNQSSNSHASSTSSTSVNVEAVNESFRQKSTVLAAFIDNQELMMKRIAFTGLYFKKLLTSGANGEVWRGEYAGQHVAIKKALGDKKDDIKTLEAFSQEIRLASTLEHPNIVRFIGLSWRALPDLCMVSEFMAVGDLAHFLPTQDGQSMTWANEKISLASDIANALVYLHSLMPVIIHRDLKSLNVLLTDDLQAKLSDFGLSREQSFEQTMTSGVGTMLWTAPEVLRGERYSEKADIYSFGIVLSELDTCLAPYSLNEEVAGVKSKSMHLLPLISKGQITPKFSPDCPEPVLELAKACLDQDPSKRPPAMQVVYTLRSKIRPVL